MLFLYLLCIFCFLILWWSYFGYFIFLRLVLFLRKNQPDQGEVGSSAELPLVSLIICSYNEEKLIEWKIANTLALDYPKDKLDIILVDGSSSDNTAAVIKAAIKDQPHMRLIDNSPKGKINQLNLALKYVKGSIVVNTDVDAELEKETLSELVKEFQKNKNVGVVGAFVEPKDACAEEVQYWRSQNRVRILESDVYSSSMVIAPCYAFKKEILKEFPTDVVADDVYIANQAVIKGYRVVYSRTARAYELRVPQNTRELVVHKFRKTNAYIIELLRSMHHLPRLNYFWRVIYITRVVQTLGAVWILILFSMLLLSLISLGEYEFVLGSAAIAVMSLGLVHIIIGRVKTGARQKVGDFFLSLRVFLILTGLLLFAALTFPFYSQGSSYEKL